MMRGGEWFDHAQAIDIDSQRGRHGPRPQWLHQMRSDLGRLDAIAEILQIRPALKPQADALGVAAGAVVYFRESAGSVPMRFLRLAAVIALAVSPAYAQDSPHINLIPELVHKTPEEKEAEAIRDKAYRESLKKIPDTKNADPWGNVRHVDTPKASAPAKPRTKTGSTAN
jgi:hypothetical protein